METTAGALARAMAFQEGIARRSAQRVVPFPRGFGVRDDRYPSSYEHNQLFVTAPAAVGEVLDGADRLLVGLAHRYVTVLDGAVAEDLAPGFLAAGYERQALVVQALGSGPRSARPGTVVERVELEALREADAETWRDDHPAMEADAVRQLFERRYTTATACDLTTHVVRRAGSVVAWCHLYRVGGEAQVESVNTLPAWRRRGFARAVVLDSVATAHAAGCDFVFLVADRDDFPRDFYARLGFDVIGEQSSFVRAPS